MSLLMLMPARLHIDISVVMPMLMFMLMSLVKTGLKVISLFCIVHPYCAYFFASLARTKHIGNMHFEVNIHLFHTIVPWLHQNKCGDPPFLLHVFEENDSPWYIQNWRTFYCPILKYPLKIAIVICFYWSQRLDAWECSKSLILSLVSFLLATLECFTGKAIVLSLN